MRLRLDSRRELALARRLHDDRFAGTWKIEILGGYTSAIILLGIALTMACESAAPAGRLRPGDAGGGGLLGVNLLSAGCSPARAVTTLPGRPWPRPWRRRASPPGSQPALGHVHVPRTPPPRYWRCWHWAAANSNAIWLDPA
jgi:hypothetical protein